MAVYVVKIGRDYGAQDLLKNARKFMSYGLAIATCIHLILIGAYWGAYYAAKEVEEMRTVRILKYSELGPPPSISGLSDAVAPSVSVESATARPAIGIPVPVPDAEVSADQTFLTQQELAEVTAAAFATGIDLSKLAQETKIEKDVKVENIDEPPPPDYVPVEKSPTTIKQVKPEYPEIARKAGMEGKVWVKIWVTKEGKVRDVLIVKSDSEIFNQAAIDAAKQFLFTPAISAAGPVAVWVTFPFVFSLR